MKVDNDQVQADGVELARNFVNNENQLINDTTQEIIMAVRKDGVAAEDVNSPKDFSFLTKLKYKDQCHPNCGGSPKAAAPMINALRETTGLIQGTHTPRAHREPRAYGDGMQGAVGARTPPPLVACLPASQPSSRACRRGSRTPELMVRSHSGRS